MTDTDYTPTPLPDEQDVDVSPAELQEAVVRALKTCYDPEIPVDIYELGLIYRVDVSEDRKVHITMTLTSPMCPVAESLPIEAERKAAAVDGVAGASVEITWDPPWTPDKMSDVAKLELGMF